MYFVKNNFCNTIDVDVASSGIMESQGGGSLEKLYDIGEVCKMLGTTSRTLRFYEEKGIVESTSVPFKTRRQYSEEQVEHIRRVLILRALGLSVSQIAELQSGCVDLTEAILQRRARIYALLNEKNGEIHLLNQALALIGDGKDVFETKNELSHDFGDERLKKIAHAGSKAIVFFETEKLYGYFSEKLIKYMPREVYERVREDTLLPIGEFVSFGKLICDKKYPNIWIQTVKYELMNVQIKFVFYGEKIDGLWLLYSED